MTTMIRHCAWYLSLYLRGTRGVAAMEYAIIAGVIVVGVGAAVAAFQNEIVGLITDVTADITAERASLNAE